MDIENAKRRFLEYLEIEKGRSLKTVENYDRYLKTFIDFAKIKNVEEITEDLIRQFNLWLNRKQSGKKVNNSPEYLKKRTKNYYLIALRSFLKYLVKIDVKSLTPEKIELAKEIIAKVPKGTLLLPSDVVVAEEINENAKAQIVKVDQVTENMKILDIGPATTAKYSEIIAQSATVIWNGPLGLYELHQFENGSKMIAHAIAESGSNSIVGGGDTADCIKRFGIDEAKFSHISTGGGACIEFLSGKKLPGIEVLAA